MKTKRQLLADIKTLQEEKEALRTRMREYRSELDKMLDYEKILNQLPGIMFKINPEGHFTYVSDSVKELGYKPEELIGKHFSDIVHSDDLARVSRREVLPRFKGKTTGDDFAPKLFDERRSRVRGTIRLELRLLKKTKNESGFLDDAEKIPIKAEVSSFGQYDSDIKDKNKQFIGTLGIMRVKQEAGEKELKAVEKEFDTLFNVIPDIVYKINPKGKFTYINEAVKKLGYEPHELIGRHFTVLLPSEVVNGVTREKVLKRLKGKTMGENKAPKLFDERRTGKRKTTRLEIPILQKRGSSGNLKSFDADRQTIIAEVTSSGNYSLDPKTGDLMFLGTVGVIRDVTDRKIAERNLLLEKDIARKYLDVARVILLFVDMTQKVTFINAKGLEVLEYSESEVLNKNWFDKFVPPEYRTDALKRFKGMQTWAIPDSYESEVLTKSGERRIISWYSTIFRNEQGKVIRVIYSGEDITERKKAEQALRSSEEKYRILFENSPSYIFLLSGDKYILDLNWSACRKMGYSKEEVLKMNIFDIINPDQWDRLIRYLEKGFRGEPTQETEIEFQAKSGAIRNVLFASEPMVSKDPQTTGSMLLTGIDITEHKSMESRLHLLGTAIEQSSELIVITDLEGKIKYANQAFENITGYTVEEAIGRSTNLLKSGKHSDAFYQDLWSTVRSGKTWNGHFINRKKDGTLYEEEASIFSVRDFRDRIVSFTKISRDVTGQKELERRFQQAQKMEAIGRLAGGVAHDFNNLLTGLIGSAEIARIKVEEDNPLTKYIDEIIKIADRGADLVGQLLAFSRKDIISPVRVDVNYVIKDMERMLSRLIGENIELITDLDPTISCIRIDPGKLTQIIINLAVNSKDAMPDGGRLIIKTKMKNLKKDSEVPSRAEHGKRYVLLEITDTGTGFDDEIRQHIFEPFFTTKEKGKGTGLGLSTVYGIIKQSGGEIEVSSLPGVGTTFQIYLPPEKKKRENIKVPVNTKKAFQTGSETILVVEDENAIRKVLKDVLTDQGYNSYFAATAKEALEICQNVKPDLLLADLVLPDVNGRDMSMQIQKKYPDIKTIYMSGYSEEVIEHYSILEKGLEFIGKPFKLRDLLKKIRTVLEK